MTAHRAKILFPYARHAAACMLEFAHNYRGSYPRYPTAGEGQFHYYFFRNRNLQGGLCACYPSISPVLPQHTLCGSYCLAIRNLGGFGTGDPPRIANLQQWENWAARNETRKLNNSAAGKTAVPAAYTEIYN